MNAVLWSVLIAGFAVVGSVIAWNAIPRRQRLKRFETRPDLSFDDIYGDFFEPKNLPRELTRELWEELSTYLHVPGGKLRPTDRFDKELAAPKGWEFDDDLAQVEWAAERRLKEAGARGDLSRIKTIGDYVEFFCSLATRNHRT